MIAAANVAVFLTTIIFVNGCEEHVFRYIGSDSLVIPVAHIVSGIALRDCCLQCAEHHNCDAVRYEVNTKKCFMHAFRTPGNAPLPQVSTGKFLYWRLANVCSDGYMTVNKTCVMAYLTENTHKTWKLAENECGNRGGILFIADSNDKREVLRQIIPAAYNSSAYVGAYMIDDGKWRWLDGKTATGIDAGGCSSPACCATINLGNPVQSNFSGVSCSDILPFVCEVPMRV